MVFREDAAGGMPGASAGAAVQELQAMVEEGAPYGFLAMGHHLVHGQHVQANLDDVRLLPCHMPSTTPVLMLLPCQNRLRC